jgi:hypothetical protein
MMWTQTTKTRPVAYVNLRGRVQYRAQAGRPPYPTVLSKRHAKAKRYA